MNDVIKAIVERRSIRKYKPDPIAEKDRDLILKAGLHAPSAKNTQSWHILAVQKPDIIDRITDEVKAALLRAKIDKYKALAENPNYRVNFGAAPLFTIVSAASAQTSCPAEDCSCVLENMFLAAHSLGIGSCWVNQLGCISDEPAFRRFITELGVPADNTIYGSAAFGYADAQTKLPPRKENTVTII